MTTYESKNTLNINGNNYKIELDGDTGEISVRHRGGFVYFHEPSMLDYFLRFYEDLPEKHQQKSLEFIKKNLETFEENKRLHRFTGDKESFRIVGHDTRNLFEGFMADHDIEIFSEEHEEKLEENFHMEIVHEVSSKEILNECLEELEEKMMETLENYGLRDMIEEWTMNELRHLFIDKKSVKIAQAAEKVTPTDIEPRNLEELKKESIGVTA